MQRILSLLGAALLGAGLLWWQLPAPSNDPPSAPQIALERMGHLASLKLSYADIVEVSDPLGIDIPMTNRYIPLGSANALLVARGQCIVGTDMQSATFRATNPIGRQAVLSMPQPRRISAGIQQGAATGGSYLYAVTSKGLTPVLPDSENRRRAINGAFAKAQKQLEAFCDAKDVQVQARKNAEDVLRPMLNASGWQVRFEWR